MKASPMLYCLRELVEGNGFIARIFLDGTALVTEDSPGEWLVSGVNPGATAATGATIREAFAELAIGFRAYLHDCAVDAPNFAAFRAEVERFFAETNPGVQQEWEDALRAIRAGAAVPASFRKVAMESSPRGIRVVEVVTPTPYQGELGGGIMIAA